MHETPNKLDGVLPLTMRTRRGHCRYPWADVVIGPYKSRYRYIFKFRVVALASEIEN